MAKLALIPGTVAGHPEQQALGLAGRTNGAEFDIGTFRHELSSDDFAKVHLPLSAATSSLRRTPELRRSPLFLSAWHQEFLQTHRSGFLHFYKKNITIAVVWQ